MYNTNRDVKDKLNIITNKDEFAMVAFRSEDKDMIDVAKAISYQDSDVTVYSLFKKREEMASSPTQFYDIFRLGLKSKAISKDILLKYAVYAKEKMKDFTIDKELLQQISVEAGVDFGKNNE